MQAIVAGAVAKALMVCLYCFAPPEEEEEEEEEEDIFNDTIDGMSVLLRPFC